MLARNKWTLLGGLFGIALSVFALGDAGAGHGTYIPLFVFSAPFIPVPPALWIYIGWLVDRGYGRSALTILGLHTIIAIPIAWFGKDDEYFTRFAKFEPEWLWGGLGIYAIGLVVAWSLAIKQWITVPEKTD